MKLQLRPVTFALALVALSALAQDQAAAPPPPTWQDMMALGIAPYRQLTVEDFPIDDKAHPKHAFHIKTAIQPRYHFILKPHTTGFVYAHIDQWMIFSGLDKRETSRKSKFKTMKAELPYVQALLDINEINARRLAALKPGELPSGRGSNFDEARADMEGKLKQFVDDRYRQNQAEMEAFAKATNNGGNKKKVGELAADTRKRLEATPVTTVPFSDAAAAVEPTPAASAAPMGSPSPATGASRTPVRQ